jgi:hypothetical protein
VIRKCAKSAQQIEQTATSILAQEPARQTSAAEEVHEEGGIDRDEFESLRQKIRESIV